jgi:hypothetical protein
VSFSFSTTLMTTPGKYLLMRSINCDVSILLFYLLSF